MKTKHKTKKALSKRVKITGTGKILRSHQLRAGHLKRHKTNRALRRHKEPILLNKTMIKSFKRMLGI
ncbi:50S ribosomal protein L35 [Candidatus Daviesbacteria bacterium]|nr:50S ribosomal protein L35 [Candidatus Daviesbacteria bacterium]